MVYIRRLAKLTNGRLCSNYQVVITIDRENRQEYVDFVCTLIKKLFDLKPAVYQHQSKKSKDVVGVTISSASLVDFLLSKGLKKGNKVRLQVGVPAWIKENQEFSKNCLRGLIDTDGCVYAHKHTSHGYKHYNIGLDFTNKSIPLLNFVYKTLKMFNFSPKLQGQRSVRLYRRSEVCRYSEEIGFNNFYHIRRLKKFLKQRLLILKK